MIAISQFLAAPCIAAVLLVPSPEVSYGLLVLAYITAETWLGPAAAIVQVSVCVGHSLWKLVGKGGTWSHCKHVVTYMVMIKLSDEYWNKGDGAAAAGAAMAAPLFGPIFFFFNQLVNKLLCWVKE